MPLIAVKPAGAGLVTVPGVGVHSRDHPVLRDPAHDPEHAILALVEILPDDRREQRRRLLELRAKLAAVQRDKQRVRVLRERVDHLLPRLPVLVIADRLPRARVIIIAAEQPAQLALQITITDGQQPADRRADQRDRVHRRDRVIQRRRIQHPPPADQPRPLRDIKHRLEDPIRTLRGPKPGAHIDQHRMHEPRIVKRQATRRVLPARVKAEPVDRLTIRAALKAL